MVRVVKIGDIDLDNPLFIKESFAIKNVQAVASRTVGGGTIVYESQKQTNANYLTLASFETGWQREETIEAIRTLADDLGVITTITTQSGDLLAVRFAHEKAEVIKAEPLYDGSRWYRVEISMCEA